MNSSDLEAELQSLPDRLADAPTPIDVIRSRAAARRRQRRSAVLAGLVLVAGSLGGAVAWWPTGGGRAETVAAEGGSSAPTSEVPAPASGEDAMVDVVSLAARLPAGSLSVSAVDVIALSAVVDAGSGGSTSSETTATTRVGGAEPIVRSALALLSGYFAGLDEDEVLWGAVSAEAIRAFATNECNLCPDGLSIVATDQDPAELGDALRERGWRNEGDVLVLPDPGVLAYPVVGQVEGLLFLGANREVVAAAMAGTSEVAADLVDALLRVEGPVRRVVRSVCDDRPVAASIVSTTEEQVAGLDTPTVQAGDAIAGLSSPIDGAAPASADASDTEPGVHTVLEVSTDEGWSVLSLSPPSPLDGAPSVSSTFAGITSLGELFGCGS